MKWLRSQKPEHREQRMALEELLEGVRQESERVERLQQAIREPTIVAHGDCPRARGLRLGDQSRGHGKSAGVMSSGDVHRSSRGKRSTGPPPLRCNQHQEG
jgi:hypothetical protein